MRFAKLHASLLSLALPVMGFAAISSHSVLSRYFVAPPSDTVMKQIAKKFEVEKRQGAGFVVIVPADQSKDLLALTPHARLLQADISAALHAQVAARDSGWHN